MTRKKFIFDIMIIGAALILFAVWFNQNHNKAIIASRQLGEYQVYLITPDKMDEHWNRLNQGASDMAAMLGVNYFWDAPVTKDSQKQIEILNNAVANGADAILIAANDPVQISSAIEAAKAKDVKIIYVDSPANEEALTTLATDNYSAGAEAGRVMISQFDELGINGGSIGIIGVNENTDSTMKREQGFREELGKDGRFTILETQYKNGDPIASEMAAVELINLDNELVGLFGTNEGSTEGVGQAIKASNRNIIGVGFDRSVEIIQLLRDGSLKAVLVQNAYTMGYLGMAQAAAALRGDDIGPPFINTGVSVYTRTSRFR